MKDVDVDDVTSSGSSDSSDSVFDLPDKEKMSSQNIEPNTPNRNNAVKKRFKNLVLRQLKKNKENGDISTEKSAEMNADNRSILTTTSSKSENIFRRNFRKIIKKAVQEKHTFEIPEEKSLLSSTTKQQAQHEEITLQTSRSPSLRSGNEDDEISFRHFDEETTTTIDVSSPPRSESFIRRNFQRIVKKALKKNQELTSEEKSLLPSTEEQQEDKTQEDLSLQTSRSPSLQSGNVLKDEECTEQTTTSPKNDLTSSSKSENFFVRNFKWILSKTNQENQDEVKSSLSSVMEEEKDTRVQEMSLQFNRCLSPTVGSMVKDEGVQNTFDEQTTIASDSVNLSSKSENILLRNFKWIINKANKDKQTIEIPKEKLILPCSSEEKRNDENGSIEGSRFTSPKTSGSVVEDEETSVKTLDDQSTTATTTSTVEPGIQESSKSKSVFRRSFRKIRNKNNKENDTDKITLLPTADEQQHNQLQDKQSTLYRPNNRALSMVKEEDYILNEQGNDLLQNKLINAPDNKPDHAPGNKPEFAPDNKPELVLDNNPEYSSNNKRSQIAGNEQSNVSLDNTPTNLDKETALYLDKADEKSSSDSHFQSKTKLKKKESRTRLFPTSFNFGKKRKSPEKKSNPKKDTEEHQSLVKLVDDDEHTDTTPPKSEAKLSLTPTITPNRLSTPKTESNRSPSPTTASKRSTTPTTPKWSLKPAAEAKQSPTIKPESKRSLTPTVEEKRSPTLSTEAKRSLTRDKDIENELDTKEDALDFEDTKVCKRESSNMQFSQVKVEPTKKRKLRNVTKRSLEIVRVMQNDAELKKLRKSRRFLIFKFKFLRHGKKKQIKHGRSNKPVTKTNLEPEQFLESGSEKQVVKKVRINRNMTQTPLSEPINKSSPTPSRSSILKSRVNEIQDVNNMERNGTKRTVSNGAKCLTENGRKQPAERSAKRPTENGRKRPAESSVKRPTENSAKGSTETSAKHSIENPRLFSRSSEVTNVSDDSDKESLTSSVGLPKRNDSASKSFRIQKQSVIANYVELEEDCTTRYTPRISVTTGNGNFRNSSGRRRWQKGLQVVQATNELNKQK